MYTKEGEIIAYDGEPSYHKITYGDNFFDFYKDRTLLSKNSLVNVKKDFSAGNDGLIKIRTDSNKKSDQYIAYTRLGMNDWMICYVIPVSDAQNSYSFIKSYEGIFMSVFCILVLLLVFYIIHNNRIRNEELRHDAQTDGLTGVLNKRTTEALINEILEQRPHEKGTFIILDVDKFKEVNDHYGHAVGDIVLSTLGQTLRNYFREMISLEESVEMSLSFTCSKTEIKRKGCNTHSGTGRHYKESFLCRNERTPYNDQYWHRICS